MITVLFLLRPSQTFSDTWIHHQPKQWLYFSELLDFALIMIPTVSGRRMWGHLSEELLQQREGPAVMEAPGFCRVADVSSVKQQGQRLGFVYPANAAIQLLEGCTTQLQWKLHDSQSDPWIIVLLLCVLLKICSARFLDHFPLYTQICWTELQRMLSF